MAEDGIRRVDPGQPLFTFGMIADVQYADLDDGYNFSKTRRRYYRNSLNMLIEAVETWNKSIVPVNFIFQLGDLIDGFNKRYGKSDEALQTVLKVLQKCSYPVHHLLGNHDLYNFDQSFLLASLLNLKPNPESSDATSYYDFSPIKGFRFIILNTYEISGLGYSNEHPFYKEAMVILRKHNRNKDLNSPLGLVGLEKRFLMFNGGVSQEQLNWLDSVLRVAEQDKEVVVVTGHIPVYEPSTEAMCLVWNYDQVLDILHSYPNTVVGYFSGHDHDGGYAVDPYGLHHVTMPGVIETVPHSNAYTTVYVHPGSMVLVGCGRAQDLVIPIPQHGKALSAL